MDNVYRVNEKRHEGHFLTVAQFVECSGFSRSTVYRWREDGLIPFMNLGSRVYLDLVEFIRFVRSDCRVEARKLTLSEVTGKRIPDVTIGYGGCTFPFLKLAEYARNQGDSDSKWRHYVASRLLPHYRIGAEEEKGSTVLVDPLEVAAYLRGEVRKPRGIDRLERPRVI